MRDGGFISVSEEMGNGGKWQPCVSDHPAAWLVTAAVWGRRDSNYYTNDFFGFIRRKI